MKLSWDAIIDCRGNGSWHVWSSASCSRLTIWQWPDPAGWLCFVRTGAPASCRRNTDGSAPMLFVGNPCADKGSPFSLLPKAAWLIAWRRNWRSVNCPSRISFPQTEWFNWRKTRAVFRAGGGWVINLTIALKNLIPQLSQRGYLVQEDHTKALEH